MEGGAREGMGFEFKFMMAGEMEGIVKVFDAVDDMATDGRGGIRCCSSTPTIHLSPRAQIVKKKTYPIRTLLQANPRSHHPRMLLQFQRNFLIARNRLLHHLDLTIHQHLRILGGILSSPSFGAKSSSSFSDIVGSGGRSSEDSSILEVGRVHVECRREAGEGVCNWLTIQSTSGGSKEESSLSWIITRLPEPWLNISRADKIKELGWFVAVIKYWDCVVG